MHLFLLVTFVSSFFLGPALSLIAATSFIIFLASDRHCPGDQLAVLSQGFLPFLPAAQGTLGYYDSIQHLFILRLHDSLIPLLLELLDQMPSFSLFVAGGWPFFRGGGPGWDIVDLFELGHQFLVSFIDLVSFEGVCLDVAYGALVVQEGVSGVVVS